MRNPWTRSLPEALDGRCLAHFVGIPDHHTGDAGGRRLHDTWRNVFASTAVILNAAHVALAEPVWDRPWGSSVRPGLIKTNQLGAAWWGVYTSDGLAEDRRRATQSFAKIFDDINRLDLKDLRPGKS